MKTTVIRASVGLLAVLGMAIGPAAAAAPASLEAPTTAPAITTPGASEPVMTPQLSPCQVMQWFYWCRVNR